MEPVLCLIEDDTLGALDDLCGDLLSLVCGQTVHYHSVSVCDRHNVGVDLISLEYLLSLLY